MCLSSCKSRQNSTVRCFKSSLWWILTPSYFPKKFKKPNRLCEQCSGIRVGSKSYSRSNRFHPEAVNLQLSSSLVVYFQLKWITQQEILGLYKLPKPEIPSEKSQICIPVLCRKQNSLNSNPVTFKSRSFHSKSSWWSRTFLGKVHIPTETADRVWGEKSSEINPADGRGTLTQDLILIAVM